MSKKGSNKGEPTLTCILVSPGNSGTFDLQKKIEGLGIPVLNSKSLGNAGDLTAQEVILPLLSEDACEALAGAVHHAAGRECDMAILPSAGRRKKILISDMDSTIIAQECLDELAGFAGLKDEISAITERAMAGELNFDQALTERVGRLKGLSLEALESCLAERITLNPGARVLVRTMAKNGAHCVLVSGGFTFFTQRIAKLAGFHAHRGNTLIDDGITLTGEVGHPILGREAKRIALEESAQKHRCTVQDALAIGDGANDLAMIEAAGLGIAFQAKPIVAAQADCAIAGNDLRTALFFQGYHADEFVTD